MSASTAAATVPGRNGAIAYALSPGEVHSLDIMVLDRGRTNSVVTRTVDIGFTNNPDPAWLPDGSRLAVSSGSGDILVIGLDGTNPVNVTQSDLDAQGPTWSPDGTRIAFQTIKDFCSDIEVVNADGTNRQTLGGIAGASNRDPDWSPDGTRIAFQSSPGIWVMDADGGNVTQIIDSGFDPSWSPDGQRIAFSDYKQAPVLNSDIYAVNADGTGLVNLTKDVGDHEPDDTNPSWSPDGLLIAFECSRNRSFDLCVMGADGSGARKIVHTGPASAVGPAWQPLPP